jgi:predicted Zn-dependent protease
MYSCRYCSKVDVAASTLYYGHMATLKRERRPYVTAYVTDEELIRLKQLALDERTTVADLIRDGLNLLLKRKKLQPLE